ncbi:MAG: hypothetical protein E7672_05680 [Ruminococcaceae bacterium]|nr:hypothetical protein [Oscillospiraceae bacterium]
MQIGRRGGDCRIRGNCRAGRDYHSVSSSLQRVSLRGTALMKNYIKLLALFLVAFLLSPQVYAVEYTFSGEDYGEEAIGDAWENFTDGLPEDIRGEVDGINGGNLPFDEIREKTSFSYWIDKLEAAISSSFVEVFGTVATLLGILVLMAALQIAVPDNAGLSSAFMNSAKLICAVFLFKETSHLVTITSSYLDRICGVMNLMTPIIDAVYLASGEITQAAVSGAALMLGVTVVGNIAGGVLVPITDVLFTLSSVSMVCDEVKIGGFAGAIRRFLMRLWQILCMFYSFMLASQTTIARHADNLAVRAAKFAIGSFIPMAGGMISESFTTLRAGVSFLKTTAGIGGIVVILLIMIPGIVPLLLYRLGLTIVSEGAKILRLDPLSSMIDEIGGIVELLLGITLCTSLMFVFAVIIFTKIGVS